MYKDKQPIVNDNKQKKWNTVYKNISIRKLADQRRNKMSSNKNPKGLFKKIVLDNILT